MKKLLLFTTVLILILSIVLSSCASSKKKEEGNVNDKPSSDKDTDSGENTVDGNESENDQGSNHTHSYGNWVTTVKATCEKEGSRERKCACGSKVTEKIAKLKHNYVGNVCTVCKQKDPNVFVSDYAPGEANVVGTDNSGYHYTAQGGYIYYSEGNKLKKLKRSSSSPESIYTSSAGNIFNVNIVEDWIYFYCHGSTVAKSYIAKVKTDGSGFQKIVSSIDVFEMIVVKNTVYYTTYPDEGVYKNYGKDVFPLYSVSTNGGTPKQIHDGAVLHLNADATYIYFIHDTEDDKLTVCRIKHGSTSAATLLKNTDVYGLTLENSKLYFYVLDRYDPYRSTLASISINGGGYTTYTYLWAVDDMLHVVGNKVYFIGSEVFGEKNSKPIFGITEYNLNSKTFRNISTEQDEFIGVFDILIWESYNYDMEKLESVTIYSPSNGTSKKIKF